MSLKLWIFVGVLCLSVGGTVAQRGTAFSRGGCLAVARGVRGYNVTCQCGHTLRQTVDFTVIDHLTVQGCGTEDPRTTKIALHSSDTSGSRDADIVISGVRSLTLTDGMFSFIAGSQIGQKDSILEKIAIENVKLGDAEGRGFPAGVLQDLPELRILTLSTVNTKVLATGAIANLKKLETLLISGCEVGLVEEGAVIVTPQLRHLHITRTHFQHIDSRAIVINANIDESACKPEIDADDSDVSFLISHCSFDSLSPYAISFTGVNRLMLEDNGIAELQKASLSVTTRSHCGRAARLHLTRNVANVVIDAPNVIIVNDDPLAAPFVHGGNEIEPEVRERNKQTGKFPPAHLRVNGAFHMSRVDL